MITMHIFDNYKGARIAEYTISNKSGASVSVLELGGIITSIKMPGKNGELGECVCGFDTCEGYMKGGGYLGAAIGRYANRIEAGVFTLGGKTYTLAKNEGGKTHLHGGDEGFNAKIWRSRIREEQNSLVLTYTSPDGEEGYPGKLDVTITYTLTEENELILRYEAVCDADCPVNLTNHSYFNLSGKRCDILGHTLKLDCDRFSPVDADFIPEGAPAPVYDTPFDFTEEKPIGRDISEYNNQLLLAGGYDHNFILRDGHDKNEPAAILRHYESGREMKVYTDLPAIQVYTANMLNGEMPLRGGEPQSTRRAICLETQFYPNSPNRPDFPSCLLKKGEKFDSTTKFAFGII